MLPLFLFGLDLLRTQSYFWGFLPSILAVTALILGTAANSFCETVMFSQVEGYDSLILFAGPWSYRAPSAQEWGGSTFVSPECRRYSYLEEILGFDYTVDAKTKTVWSFAIITPILGCVLIFVACFGFCMGWRIPWKQMGASFFLTSAFQGITLLIQSSSICYDNPAIQYLEVKDPDLANSFPAQCKWAGGFKINIAAVIFWALAGVCAFAAPPPPVTREKPRQEQTVTYTQNPNGTVEEARVQIVKGAPVPQ